MKYLRRSIDTFYDHYRRLGCSAMINEMYFSDIFLYVFLKALNEDDIEKHFYYKVYDNFESNYELIKNDIKEIKCSRDEILTYMKSLDKEFSPAFKNERWDNFINS